MLGFREVLRKLLEGQVVQQFLNRPHLLKLCVMNGAHEMSGSNVPTGNFSEFIMSWRQEAKLFGLKWTEDL